MTPQIGQSGLGGRKGSEVMTRTPGLSRKTWWRLAAMGELTGNEYVSSFVQIFAQDFERLHDTEASGHCIGGCNCRDDVSSHFCGGCQLDRGALWQATYA